MSAAAIAIIVVVVAVVVVIAAMATGHGRRLRQRFGPEYDRVVGERRSQFRAATELTRRERRVHRLDIRPLTATAQAEYAAEWRAAQEAFVDQPQHAVLDGADLVASVMKERGYPAEGPSQIVADLSVTHPGTLDHYRVAQQISADAERGDASTEDLRQALIHYRAVFGELLGQPAAAAPREPTEPREPIASREPTALREPTAPRALDGANSRGAEDTEARTPDGAGRVPDGPEAPAPDGAGRVPDGAGREPGGTPDRVPDEKSWRPAVRVPPARASGEERGS